MLIQIVDLTKTKTDVITVERLDTLLQNIEKEEKMNKTEIEIRKEDTPTIQEMIEEEITKEMIEVEKDETVIQDLEVETTQGLIEIEVDQEIGLKAEKETTEEPHHHTLDM